MSLDDDIKNLALELLPQIHGCTYPETAWEIALLFAKRRLGVKDKELEVRKVEPIEPIEQVELVVQTEEEKQKLIDEVFGPVKKKSDNQLTMEF